MEGRGHEEGEDERQSDRVMNPRGGRSTRVMERPPKFFKRTFAIVASIICGMPRLSLLSCLEFGNSFTSFQNFLARFWGPAGGVEVKSQISG